MPKKKSINTLKYIERMCESPNQVVILTENPAVEGEGI